MPVLSGEVDETSYGKSTRIDTTSLAADAQHHTVNSAPSPAQYPASANQQQQPQQYLQAGAISPGVTFSDEHYEQYDSDMEAELDLGPSRETLHEGQILKSGYLHKKGERIKIWKKKWFVLRTSKLAYYKDSKEYVLLRIIDIRDIHKAAEVVVKNRVGVFVILTPRRTFTVQADSVAEMEEWITAINQAKVQYELTSSSDMDNSSYAGSNVQLEQHPSSAPQSGSRKPELIKQGSGTFLPRRQQNNPMSLSDPGLLGSGSGNSSGESAVRIGRNISPPVSSTLPRIPDANVSGLSLGIMSQSMGQLPSASSSAMDNSGEVINNNNVNTSGVVGGRHLQPSGNRVADGLSLVTSGTQAIRIGGGGSGPSPLSPPRQGQESAGSFGDLPSNSFSSNYSFNTSPGTPNSPGYGSGGEQYGMGEQNVSSEEEDVVDDPTVLEAGRVAAAANAPGSGLVTGEQLESKVVRQGYLLKLGNTYKTWRKKWFVLRGDKLTYYKNAKEYQPLGIIPLSTIIDSLQTDPVSKHKQYCLRIVTSKRSFVCCAPEEDTLLQWIDALHVECARVAREAQREKDGVSPLSTITGDDDMLADPRALGRTAHMDLNNTPPQQGLAPGDGSAILGSSAQLKHALNLDTGADGSSHAISTPITFSSSPVSKSAPPLSVSFQTPPSTRLLHDEGGSTTRSGPATVTFSV